jgi:hypothetical protein
MRDTYGVLAWTDVINLAGLQHDGFEPMLQYEDAVTHGVLEAMAQVLSRPLQAVLEDLGTYLVTHANTQAIRRLLRFGGDTFADFLLSLDDLPERARLAVPDLQFPALELEERGTGDFRLWVRGEHPEFVWMLCGALRALADDYGALVLMDGFENPEGGFIDLHLAALSFAEGNAFSLGVGGTAAPHQEREAG